MGDIVDSLRDSTSYSENGGWKTMQEAALHIEKVRSALELAVNLGWELGLTEMEVDAIYGRAGLTRKEQSE